MADNQLEVDVTVDASLDVSSLCDDLRDMADEFAALADHLEAKHGE